VDTTSQPSQVELTQLALHLSQSNTLLSLAVVEQAAMQVAVELVDTAQMFLGLLRVVELRQNHHWL